MIAGSLFSGVGGLDLGLTRAGYEHAFFAEVDPWRRDVISAHYPGATVYPDVRDVAQGAEGARPGRLGAVGAGRGGGDDERARLGAASVGVDLLAGGFPCQDLSVAGKRAGLAGARSGLFHEFARIADTLRPTWLLLENVPGLLSSNDGRDMGVVVGTLADLGYGVAWRILDARYFGVPQRRRRVFIVCRAGGDDASALRALCEGCDGDLAAGQCSWQGSPRRASNGASLVGGAVSTLQAHGKGRGYRIDAEAAAGGHLLAFHQTQEPITEEEMSPAIGRTSIGMGIQSQNVGVRRLTPIECERLMSWPDGWTAPEGVKAPDSRRYAACGDGVVSNVAEWIGRRITAIEEEA